MAGDLGSAGIILIAWLAGATFAFFGALVYGELAVNNPQSGGEYIYLTKAHGPSWGFMSGWVSFFAVGSRLRSRRGWHSRAGHGNDNS